MPLLDYDPRREAEGLERRETELQREDYLFELRRYEPLEGLGRVYRADENYEEGTGEWPASP